MPDYDLGKAHGEVEIDYDSDGIARAKGDLDDLGDAAEDASKRVKDSSKVTQQEYDAMAKAADRLQADVEKLAAADIAAKAKQEAAANNLNKIRENSESTAKQVADAEKLLKTAQNDSKKITDHLAISTEGLRATRERLNNQEVNVDIDINKDNLDEANRSLLNIDKSTKEGLTGLNTYTGRLGLLAKAAVASAPAVANVASALVSLSGLAGIGVGAVAALGVSYATLKVGMQGVDGIFKDIAKSGKVSDETMKQLAPSAQEFARSLQKINPAWEAVQKSVQNALFQRLGKDIEQTANVWIPLLQGKMTNLAGGFNEVARNVLAFFRAEQTIADSATIFDNTTAAVHNLSTVGNNLLGIFRDIAVVGSGFLPEIATGFTNATQRAQDFIVTARETGQLHNWMQAGLDALQQLWELLKNVGSIAGSVFSALSDAGGGAFNTLVSLTGQLAAFLKTAEGQQFLQALAEAMAAIGQTYGRVFLALLQALVPVVIQLAPLVAQFATAVGNDLVLGLQAITPLLGFLAGILGAIGPVIVPVIAAMYAMNKAVQAATVVWRILNAVLKTNPFILIASIILALAVLIYENWDSISAFLSKVWNGIKSVAESVWNGIKDFFSNLIDTVVGFFKRWGTLILAVLLPFIGIPLLIIKNWDKIVSFFSGIINSVIGFFKELPGKVGSFLASLPGIVGNALLTALKWGLNAVIQGIEWIIAEIIAFPLQVAWVLEQFGQILWNAFTAAFTFALNAVIAGATAIYNFFATIIPTIWNFLASLPSVIGQLFTDAWNWALNTSVAIATAIWNFIASIPGVVWNFLAGLPAMLGNLFTNAWNWVRDTTINIVNAVWSFVSQIPGRILGFLSGLPGMLGNLARNAWNWFRDGVVSVANDVIGWVQGIPGRILSALGNLGGLLLGAGRAIIDGLLAGIRSAVSGVYDFVSGIAGKIASLKGPISYDRKLLVPAGSAIMEGLHSGLVDGFDPVLYTVSQMAGQISDTLNSSLDNVQAQMQATVTTTISPLGQAAQEVLDAWNKGTSIFEDFSYYGNSQNVRDQNDTLAAGYHGTTTSDLEAYLKGVVAQQTTTTNTPAQTSVGTLNLNVAGNLDPTNKVAWRDAIKNIQDSLDNLARQY